MDLYYDDEDDEELPKRNPVYSQLAGGILDLDQDDLGYPHIPDLWQRLRADKRPVPQRGLWCPTCIRVRPSQPEWMYVYERANGQKIAAHHNPKHKAHDNESPEHRAYKERIAHAAELGGHHAEIELRSADGQRRSDVQVTGVGGQLFGFETQLSYATTGSIQRRDRVGRGHGLVPVWHVTDRKAPLIDHVQWARTDNLPAEAIRDDRDLLVRGGVRGLALERCDSRNPLPCPVKKSGRCGKWHPKWEPKARQLDDLVRDIAAGEFVQVVEKFGQRTRRFWTPAADRQKFVDNGGVLLPGGVLVDAPVVPRQAGRVSERRQVQCTRDRRDEFHPVPIPPRDSGETYRPAVTIGPRRFSDLSAAEVLGLAREYGCRPDEVGPCGRCYGPTKRYGEGARVLCVLCR